MTDGGRLGEDGQEDLSRGDRHRIPASIDGINGRALMTSAVQVTGPSLATGSQRAAGRLPTQCLSLQPIVLGGTLERAATQFSARSE